MITLLKKLLDKHNKGKTELENRQAYGILCGLVGIFLNFLLFLGKYFAGVISGSIAITADAFNNLMDSGSSFVSLIGFKLASKKPDGKHPFGHGRIEYLSGLIISIAIMFIGVELFKSSIEDIITPKEIETSLTAFVILGVSICIKIYMFIYNIIIGKKLNSTSMKATAMDSIGDAVATFVVFVSMIVTLLTGASVDGWCGIFVAIFILYAGFSSLKDAISPLLGKPVSREFVEKIKAIVLSFDEIIDIHDVIVHDYGPGRVMVSLHAEVDGSDDIFKLHEAIDAAEKELFNKLSCEATIHMDPIETNDEKIIQLRKKIYEIIKIYNKAISMHDFRVVPGKKQTNVIFDIVVPFETKQSDEKIKQDIAKLIKLRFDNYVAVINIDKPFISNN